jgi:hypothetical protein
MYVNTFQNFTSKYTTEELMNVTTEAALQIPITESQV